MITPKKEFARHLGVDIVRVLAMLMVINLHTILAFTLRADFFATKTWFILEPLVAFSKMSVLLFFMLSGYLVINKNRSIKENWIITRNRILIPLCFFSVIDLVYKQYRFSLIHNNSLLFWQKQLQNITNFPDSSLWFLAVLFFMYLLNPLWNIVFSKERSPILALYLTKLALIFSICVTILKFPGFKQTDFFNSYTLWLGYLFFYFYGGLVKNGWVSINKKKVNVMMVILGLLAIIMGDYYTLYAKIHSLSFIWSGYFFEYLSIPIILSAVGMFNLFIASNFVWLTKCKVVGAISLLAKLSYGIYLIHPFVVTIFNDILGFDFDKLVMNVYLYNVLNYFLVLSIGAIITYVFMKVPRLRIIVGGGSS